MKFTMIIADDEILALKSEEIRIAKDFPNIDIIATAKDGIEFKELVEKKSPDMALVDIRMPGITGLEAIRLLRSNGCKTHFIVNTAYSEFEYVKVALNLKSDGYLIKPTKREEFIEVISNICSLIEEEKKQQENITKVTSVIQSVSPIIGNEILMSIFSSRIDEKRFNLYCELNSIEFSSGCILTMLPKRKESNLSKKKIREILADALDGVCNYLETISDDSIILMIIFDFGMSENNIKSLKEAVVSIITNNLEKKLGVSLLVGSGEVYDKFAHMTVSYYESLKAFDMFDEVTGLQSKEKVNGYVEKAKAYVSNHYFEDISLDDCAENIGISSCYFSHIFKQIEGKTFIKYLVNFRIDEAKRLCRESDYEIKEISQRCGYNNLSYFYKVFKRVTGVTIGQYRDSLQEG